jgi:uncharacterized membrane protein YtjA (UPF0391 family)
MAGGRLIAVDMVIYLIIIILLTPLGFETRPSSSFTTTGIATLVLVFVGVALVVASLVLLAYRPRRSPILAVVGVLLYFPIFFADQAGQFSALRAPTAISYLEYLQALVAIVVIALALRFRKRAQAT